MRRRPVAALLVALSVAGVVGCGSGDEAVATTGGERSVTGPDTAGASHRDPGATTAARTAQAARGFRLARVAGGLGDALHVTGAPGQRNRLFVARQSGRIQVLDRGRVRAAPFLDLSGAISAGGERGLLGLAFHPGYARNGRFYVNYTDRAGDTQVVEYRRASATRANPRSARRLLSISQPFANHNGGHLAFGPDGHLYIGTGDGGGGGDPRGNGQSRTTLLGKILRIDVDARTGGRPYGIPRDNPFRGGGGRPEIYAYGLRNPWRFSFDRARGDMWIADVGQSAVEEVNFRPRGRARGANFGWNAYEGRARFAGPGAIRGRAPVFPVAQYGHARGCSVTGGYVYRGARVPALRGRYVFADYCSGRVWTMRAGPRPGGLREDTGRLGTSLATVTSFGEGQNGDLYVIANRSLYRFVPRAAGTGGR
jgi:glucose/arabinose dehydrogenase